MSIVIGIVIGAVVVLAAAGAFIAYLFKGAWPWDQEGN
jgi:hypothetical protein